MASLTVNITDFTDFAYV